jgi:hypothetical protein
MNGMMPPTEAEIAGASRIKWGALLGTLGLVLAIAGVFIVLLDVGFAAGGGIASTANFQTILNTIFLAIGAILAGVALAFLSFVLYMLGFASLRKADGRFTVPLALLLIGLIGLLLLLGFAGLYAAGIHSALGCASTDTTCQNNATSLPSGSGALLYGGGLLAFVGLIGAILGLWRFGSRYQSGVTKVGAILYIIPVLAILAPILVLIGSHQVQKRLSHTRASASASMMPPMTTPPPPSM